MLTNIYLVTFLIVLVNVANCNSEIKYKNRGKYLPTWKSLDSRPLPQWYDNSKIGIFLHWGVFSVPSFTSEWFWYYWKSPAAPKTQVPQYMKDNYPPKFTYADFASEFKADLYQPNDWADIFKASGAKYVVLVTKHHEGFCNWPTEYSFNWNSQQVGPMRDLVGELAQAVRQRTDIKFGLYHSLFEWFNPLFLKDSKNKFQTHHFANEKSMPELYELVEKYRPDVIWSDGNVGPSKYWNSTGFLAWLYNESPVRDTVVTNDRWGDETMCKNGGFYTCADRYNPGHKLNHKWENCLSLDFHSWGFRRNTKLSDVITIEELVYQIASTVSCGGNVLINVGPTSSGVIAPIYEERLRQMGQWLHVNGEAIYDTQPWLHQNDTLTPDIWYTQAKLPNTKSGSDVYAILLKSNVDRNMVILSNVAASDNLTVQILTREGAKLLLYQDLYPIGIKVYLPAEVKQLALRWGLVLRISGL